jgi:hypothetical protein
MLVEIQRKIDFNISDFVKTEIGRQILVQFSNTKFYLNQFKLPELHRERQRGERVIVMLCLRHMAHHQIVKWVFTSSFESYESLFSKCGGTKMRIP